MLYLTAVRLCRPRLKQVLGSLPLTSSPDWNAWLSFDGTSAGADVVLATLFVFAPGIRAQGTSLQKVTVKCHLLDYWTTLTSFLSR